MWQMQTRQPYITLEQAPMPLEGDNCYVITCQTVKEEIEAHLPSGIPMVVVEFGLHNTPDKLHVRLQDEIDKAPAGATILLGYGLCGGGADGLRAGRHRLVIPRAHDCIALFLGSREAYHEQSSAERGTYYVTKGWLTIDGDGPIGQYEKMVEKYGPEKGLRLARLAFENYTRLAFIHTGNYEAEKYRELAEQVAELYQLRFEEIPGSPHWVKALIHGPWDPERFLVVEPGGVVQMRDFM